MFTLLFVGANILTLLIALWGFVLFFRTPKPKLLNMIIISLLVIIAGQIILQMLSFGDDVSEFLEWFVNLDDDRNLPATLAAGQWAILGFTAMSAGFASKISAYQRVYWGLIGVLFLYIAIDDFYAIHEYLIPNWRVTYLIIAGIIGAISLVVVGILFRRDFRKNPRPWLMMFIGVIILGISGFFIESLLYSACDEMGSSIFCQNWKIATTLEECVELIGTTLVSAGLLLYVQNRLSERIWRRAVVLIGSGALGLVFILLGYLWVLPSIALQVTAERVDVVYEDERIALAGYWLPTEVVRPGDRLYLWLYWRALKNRVKTDYRLSVHAIQRPDGTSVAQADRLNMGEIPSQRWLKDSIQRKPLHIDLPDDLPTGVYDIAVRVWSGQWQSGWQNTIGLPPSETDLELLTDDMVIIGSFVVLGDEPRAGTPDTQTHYAFEPGVNLIGYDILDAVAIGGQLELGFRWTVEHDLDQAYIHFVHLFHQDSDYYTIFDRVPFDGRFPTDEWRAGWTLTDTFSLQLPDDMPSGSYTLRSGLYRTSDGERAHITDPAGNPVTDWSIPLADITVQE